MSYTTPLTTLGTCTPSLSVIQSSSPTSHTLLSEFQPCADQRHRLIMGPNSLLNTRIISFSPKTSSSLNTRILLNTRIYVSTPFSSTHRAWRRPTILLGASWHRLRTRTWTMTKFVFCWHHHCQDREANAERPQENTLHEKTWCPVHLKIRQVRGDLSRCFQAKTGQIKKHFPTEKDFFRTSTLIVCIRTSNFLSPLQCVLFEDNEAVIKMIIKGRSPTIRHVSWTHRVALDWLFDRINLDPKIQIKYVDSKHQLADILTKENFTRDEWNNLLHLFNISLFRSLCCSQNSSLTSCTNYGEKDARTGRRRQDSGKVKADDDEPGLHCLHKFFDCAESGCVEKPGDTQSTLLNRLVKYRDTWRKRSQSRRGVEFSRMAKRCSSGCRYEEIRRDRRRPGTPEFPWRLISTLVASGKLRNRRQWQKLATQSPYINKLRAAHGEGFLDRETKIWSQADRSNEGPRSQHSFLVYFYLSLFKLRFILVKITQKKCDLPGINPRNLWDSHFKWLRGWSLTRLKLLVLQRLIGSSLCGERRLCLLTELFSLQLPRFTSFVTQC